jgi:sortase B
MAFCCYKIYNIYNEYNIATKSYESLLKYVDTEEGQQETTTTTTNNNTKKSTVKFPKVDFNSLEEINGDIVAWLYGEEGVINYPITHTDNDNYYLEHLFDKSVNSSGCLFLECNNQGDFSDFNSVVYGHNMKNGSMFAGLGNYKGQEYYNAHPTMLLMTPEKNYVVEIFSGYVSNVDDDAWEISFKNNKEKENWIKEVSDKSVFKSKVEPSVEDNIITLSTCSYEFDNARFVLHGVLR